MLGVMGIIISLGLLMYLAYRGINVLILAPLMALLAVLLSGDATLLLPTYTQLFMKELGGYLIRFFPLFMLGAIFGKLMDDSGSAKAIAHWIVSKVGKAHAITAIVLSCGILTYGGVSLFVVAFAVYPIGAALMREINMPKRFIPGAIALGSFTFTMTAFPGTPAIQNAIPMPFFGTNTFAAPGLGTIGGLMMMFLGIMWLQTRAKRAMAAGEGYGDHKDEGLNEHADSASMPSIFMALLPIILVIGLNALLTYQIFPSIDAGYLADKKYGATSLKSVAGIWSIIVALVIAIVFIIVVHWKRWKSVVQSLNSGTMGFIVADLQHGVGSRLRQRDRLARGLRRGQGNRARHFRQSADLRGSRGQRAGRHHRLCFRRHEHCLVAPLAPSIWNWPTWRTSVPNCCTVSP